jgi:hypothetical protein
MLRLKISTNVIEDIIRAIAYAFGRINAQTEIRSGLTDGNMFIVFDDVDSNSTENIFALDAFANHFPKNWVLAISNTDMTGTGPQSFYGIRMAEWGAQQLDTYAQMRLADDPNASFLVSKVLESNRVFRITPVDAQCIIDACRSNTIYRYLEPSRFEDEQGTSPFDLFFAAIASAAGIETETAFRTIGRISLILLMRATTRFNSDEFPHDRKMIAKLTAQGLFIEYGETLAFPFHLYQEILAARYILICWDDALQLIRKGPARPLIWSSVYTIASRMLTKERLAELDHLLRDTTAL